jgi:predicted DNA-binding protein
MSGSKQRKVYTIRFPPGQRDVIDELAKEFGVTKADVIRQALRFYAALMMAQKKKKRIILEDEKTGEREWLVLS